MALATLEGLDGVSIARIAAATGMPKSSVYVLFGSKEELQLATIDAARANFIRHVVTPAITTTPPGRQRLQRLCDGYLDYVEQRIFPGGCFFVTASAEMGGRHGPVRDRVALYQQQWRQLLSETTRQAHTAHQLPLAPTPTSSHSNSAQSSPDRTSQPSCMTTTRSSTAPAKRSARDSTAKTAPPSARRPLPAHRRCTGRTQNQTICAYPAERFEQAVRAIRRQVQDLTRSASRRAIGFYVHIAMANPSLNSSGGSGWDLAWSRVTRRAVQAATAASRASSMAAFSPAGPRFSGRTMPTSARS